MRVVLTLLFTIPAVLWGTERPSRANPRDSRVQYHAPSTLVASSSNFIIRSHPGGPPASELLKTCQQLREQLQATWLGDISSAQWRPRCEVVVHGSRASYQQAVGRSAGQSYGSSLIKFESRQVVTRRIDLLPGADGRVSALAHELTHVVLADRFRGRQPPRWVDEGIATLADAPEKRRLHRRDCQYALHSGTAFPLNVSGGEGRGHFGGDGRGGAPKVGGGEVGCPWRRSGRGISLEGGCLDE